MKHKHLLTVNELAKALNCSTSTIYRMIRDGMIPYIDIRSSYRFDLEDVRKALRHN